MSIIVTHTKRTVNLLDFKLEDVCIADIVNGLDQIRRFNGRGFSVLRHTMMMVSYVKQRNSADGVVNNDALREVLLHDVAEAYIGDIIQPVKQAIPQIAELENTIKTRITMALLQKGAEQYPAPTEAVLDYVKYVDNLALAAEYHVLFGDYEKADKSFGFYKLDRDDVYRMIEIVDDKDWLYNGPSANTPNVDKLEFEIMLLRLVARENLGW
jgi:hypothetical protein